MYVSLRPPCPTYLPAHYMCMHMYMYLICLTYVWYRIAITRGSRIEYFCKEIETEKKKSPAGKIMKCGTASQSVADKGQRDGTWSRGT